MIVKNTISAELARQELNIYWFRRDLRLQDNTGLYHALSAGKPVMPIFIFDRNILDRLPGPADARVQFIHQQLGEIQQRLESAGSSLLVFNGTPRQVFSSLLEKLKIHAVFTNTDYEPYAKERDSKIEMLLGEVGIPFFSYKDHVIFEKDEILTAGDRPYTVFTPYFRKWRGALSVTATAHMPSENLMERFLRYRATNIPGLEEIGFSPTSVPIPPAEFPDDIIRNYHKQRDYPAVRGTTRIGIHLRFGTISIRQAVRAALELNETWLSELAWRDFFTMILWHYPRVVEEPFKSKYIALKWGSDAELFDTWCKGKTGYPLVDAGIRELNATGFMHNRVRMLTASFLCKHLLIDWRLGEQYFAEKLLDFDLASNNGNWQWVAGCGCDAAPYFRIFNPTTQQAKFDPQLEYIKKWVPELNTPDYPAPIVEHRFARERALQFYKSID